MTIKTIYSLLEVTKSYNKETSAQPVYRVTSINVSSNYYQWLTVVRRRKSWCGSDGAWWTPWWPSDAKVFGGSSFHGLQIPEVIALAAAWPKAWWWYVEAAVGPVIGPLDAPMSILLLSGWSLEEEEEEEPGSEEPHEDLVLLNQLSSDRQEREKVRPKSENREKVTRVRRKKERKWEREKRKRAVILSSCCCICHLDRLNRTEAIHSHNIEESTLIVI